MNLKTLSNLELENHFKNLIIRERKVLHWILEFLKEIERRKLYLEKGRSSLYEYLTKDMGYSGGAAQRRIEAIRLMSYSPELSKKIETGLVNLSQVGIVAQAIKQKESETGQKVTGEIKQELIQQLENKNTPETQKLVAQALDLKLKPLEQKQVQKDESVSLTVTLTKEQYKKLITCQELLGHKLTQENKNINLANSFEGLMDFYISKKKFSNNKDSELKKLKTGVERTLLREKTESLLKERNKRVSSKNSTPGVIVPEMTLQKTISAQLRKLLFQKHPHCQFRKQNGHKCQSQFKLEVEHLRPRWAGGDHNPDNLTVLCANHNKFKYRQQKNLNYVKKL